MTMAKRPKKIKIRYRASMTWPWLMGAKCVRLKGNIVRYQSFDLVYICEAYRTASHQWFDDPEIAANHLFVMLAGASLMRKSGNYTMSKLVQYQLYDFRKVCQNVLKSKNLN